MTIPRDQGQPTRPGGGPDHSLERRFTIAELAEASGTPVRRIRYYQTQGLLDPPRLVGRTGFYGNDHLQRLWAIASLRHRGIETGAIREILDQAPLDPSTALRQWLDATEPVDEAEVLRQDELTYPELAAKVEGMPEDTLDRLLATGLVERIAGTDPPRYLVSSVACDLVIDLERTTGLPLQITAVAGSMIADHAEQLADELGDYALHVLAEASLPPIDVGAMQQALIDAATRVSTVWLRHHLHETVRRRAVSLGLDPPSGD